jgi:hypothetical protein
MTWWSLCCEETRFVISITGARDGSRQGSHRTRYLVTLDLRRFLSSIKLVACQSISVLTMIATSSA